MYVILRTRLKYSLIINFAAPFVRLQNVMKQEQSAENRLDGSVMQQVSEHQNNMGMGMMDNMGLGIPMMISSANQQQITSVPMDTSGNSVQTVQAVPGPSSQTTHNQISQSQTSSTQQEEEEESSEDEENSDEECDGDEGVQLNYIRFFNEFFLFISIRIRTILLVEMQILFCVRRNIEVMIIIFVNDFPALQAYL